MSFQNSKFSFQKFKNIKNLPSSVVLRPVNILVSNSLKFQCYGKKIVQKTRKYKMNSLYCICLKKIVSNLDLDKKNKLNGFKKDLNILILSDFFQEVIFLSELLRWSFSHFRNKVWLGITENIISGFALFVAVVPSIN